MKKFLINLSVVFFIFALCLSGLRADAFGKQDKIKNETQKSQTTTVTDEDEDDDYGLPAIPIPDGILSQASYQISAINPMMGVSQTGIFYPGGRGANQLVIYTYKNGLRTGTNEFGAEAIVVDGTVVQISGADSIIPKDGLVISGHGRAKTWMNENLTVGTKIYVDYKTMTLYAYLTNDSFIYATQEKIKEID